MPDFADTDFAGARIIALMTMFPHKIRTLARLLSNREQRGALKARMRYNWMLLRTQLSGKDPFVVLKGRVRYACFPKDEDSWLVCNMDVTDPLELQVLRRWLKSGDTGLDGGANLGIYSAAAAQFVGARGNVLAVDAGGTIINQLERSAALLGYPQLRCLHAAIGDHEGEVQFFEALPGQSSFGQSLRVEDNQVHTYTRRVVRMTTLSRIAANLRALPHVVKLDVEGAENDALAGAPPPWLKSDGPLWIVEINPTALALFNATPADIVRHFPSDAFDNWLLPKNLINGGGNGETRPYAPHEKWSDSAYYNLLAIPRAEVWRKRRQAVELLLRRS